MLPLAGCGRGTPTKQVDVAELQHQISRVTHLRLEGQGFDYNARVRCSPTTQAFTYSCDVLITNPAHGKHVEWTEAVVCRSVPLPGVARCSSSKGEALQ